MFFAKIFCNFYIARERSCHNFFGILDEQLLVLISWGLGTMVNVIFLQKVNDDEDPALSHVKYVCFWQKWWPTFPHFYDSDGRCRFYISNRQHEKEFKVGILFTKRTHQKKISRRQKKIKWENFYIFVWRTTHIHFDISFYNLCCEIRA